MPKFRRLLLAPERLPEELKRIQDGVLLRLPLAEFDALVERARRMTMKKVVPRLLEARYHATLKEESLFGEGQWRLVHPGPAPALLPLESFNLALRQARFENGDALIAAFDGKTPALLVEKPGERSVSLDWSARGEYTPQGLQFHLELPACPVSLLELDVPVEQMVAVLDDDSLLSGPHESESADLRRWKIVCGGRQRGERQRVDFRVSTADRPTTSEPSPPFVRMKTTQKLHPDGLDAEFDLSLDGLPGGIRELVCECDADLRLRDVVGPGVAGCSFRSGDSRKPSLLTIRLRESVRSGTWQILCLAPLSCSAASGGQAPIAWRSPGLRLVNAVPRGETLTLWLHPDFRVESWDAGSYHLDSATIDRATGSQVLTLTGGGLNPTRRPMAHLQAHGIEFSVRQLTWWRCVAAGMSLTVQISWDVKQGQLLQLPVQLPANWSVDKVEMTPAGRLRDWYIRDAEGRATLLVDLASPLGVRSKSESELPGEMVPTTAASPRSRLPTLTIHLRPSFSLPITEKVLDFPDAVPLGARLRQAALALDFDEQLYHISVQTTAERTEPEAEGPWGQQLPEYYYRFYGQTLSGTVHIRPRPPRLRAQCESDVFIGSGEAVLETRLLLEAEVGSPNTIELFLSASDGESWHWSNEPSPRGDDATTNRIRRAERIYTGETSTLLHCLAASNALQVAVVQAAQPRGERWRLTLARPVHAREPLRLRARRRLRPHENRWQVPLPFVLGTDRMEGEVKLYLSGVEFVQVHSTGLREAAAVVEKAVPPPWRTFRYGLGEVRLSLSGQAVASNRPNTASIEQAQLITYVETNRVLRHHFSFQLVDWGERSLPLRLPRGSQLWAVQVDGRWLPRLVPTAEGVRVEADSSNGTAEPIELALPVPAGVDAPPGKSLHRFEVVYTRSVPAWSCWQAFDAVCPSLPVAPLAFRRIWRLPPELTPFFQGRYQSVPGMGEAKELALLPRHADAFFRLPSPLDPLQEDSCATVREALERAALELRIRHAEQTLSLRDMVSETAFDYLKDRCSFLIDATALREAGIGKETSITIKPLSSDPATPPWAACGLRALPTRSGVLLTTVSGHGAVLREPFSDQVEEALEEAVRYGRDACGRFLSALDWLHPDTTAGSNLGPSSHRLEFTLEDRNWSEWEPVVGVTDDRLLVVRRDVVTALGLGLSLLLGFCFWLLGRCAVPLQASSLLFALSLSGLGVIWLPVGLRDLAWWPLLVAGATAGLKYLGAIRRNARDAVSMSSPPKNGAATAAVVGMLVLAILGWPGRAAAPAPVVVYLVPGQSDAPEKQTVLVPADFLDRLKALARPTPLVSGGPSAVLLDASYEGQLLDGGKQAEFTAVFSAYNLDVGTSTLLLPFSSVQLMGEVLVDGAPAAPLALPAPNTGYSLSVRGRGRHKVELRFRVPAIGTAEDRNVRFTAPTLSRSRLSWRIPPGAAEPRVLVKNGAQWTSGPRLEADLGAVPLPVHLHWYQPSHPPRLSYQAAYLWDLGVESSHLAAALRYRVEQGATKTLAFDLPAELEVRAASAQRTLSAARLPWQTRLQFRNWYVTHTGSKRTLHCEFPYPVSGEFQVTLELVPRAPLSSPASLPVPLPQGAEASGPHYLAYRTQSGLTAQRETSQNLTRIGNREFAMNWPGEPRLDASFQGIAYRIAAQQTPKLLLRLEQARPSLQSQVAITVQSGRQRAEIEVDAQISAPNKDLAALEWELPPHCLVSAVTGAEVRNWKQTDSRLLVWFSRTTTRTRLYLRGRVILQQREGQPSLELNGPRLLHTGKHHTRLHLVPSGEVELTRIQTRNLHLVSPDGRLRNTPHRSSDGENILETWDSSFQLSCQVQNAVNVIARVLTLAEVADRQLRFTTTVDYTVRQGELRHIRLRLRNWNEEKVDVEAERVALWSGARRAMGERSWLLPLQPGVHGHYRVTLRGNMPLDKAAVGVSLPEVLVQDVERAEYLVAIVGGELTAQAKGALQSVPPPRPMLREVWPRSAERIEQSGGQAWRVSGPEWQLRLLPHARALEPLPVRVYLLEQSATVVDGKRWIHEARYWLSHEAHAELHLVFPRPAHVLAASVDGVEVTPVQAGSARVRLALPGQPGVRSVLLRWFYDHPEPLDRPQLSPPQLADAMKGPVLGTVMIPAGWRVASDTPSNRWCEGTAREALLALRRADAQLHLMDQLLLRKGDKGALSSLVAAQKGFDAYTRHARHALDLSADHARVTGPRGQSLAEWLEELQANFRSLSLPIRDGSARTSKLATGFGAPVSAIERKSGIPLSWHAQPGEEPVRLQLISRESQETRQAFTASGQWLACLVLAGMLIFLPFSGSRLRFFWPEQVALLGLLGWHWAGLTSVVAALLLVAVCGRVVLMLLGLRSLLRRRRQQGNPIALGNDAAAEASPGN